MASEDSRKHFFKWPCSSLPLAVRIHRISTFDDPGQAGWLEMLLAVHHPDDLAKMLERRALAAEWSDVSFKERNDSLDQHACRRDLEDQDFRTSWLRKDLSMSEDFLRELEQSPAALVLIQKEAWINIEPRPAGRMLFYAHAEGAFALDEAR